MAFLNLTFLKVQGPYEDGKSFLACQAKKEKKAPSNSHVILY